MHLFQILGATWLHYLSLTNIGKIEFPFFVFYSVTSKSSENKVKNVFFFYRQYQRFYRPRAHYSTNDNRYPINTFVSLYHRLFSNCFLFVFVISYSFIFFFSSWSIDVVTFSQAFKTQVQIYYPQCTENFSKQIFFVFLIHYCDK